MINWKVRIKNKAFWIAIIPAILVLIQGVAELLGFKLDIGNLGNRLLDIVNTVFIILGIVGIVNDPTTYGYTDSIKALTYDKPKRG